VQDSGAISVQKEGKCYQGDWRIENGNLVVTSPGLGSKQTRVGGSAGAPVGLARVLLDELVSAYLSRKSA